MVALIEVKNLSVELNGKTLLKDLSFSIGYGETLVLLGPNGAGKSTLTHVLMGDPRYKIVSGEILFEGKNILDLETFERARLGMFLSFQQPVVLSGVSYVNFLRTSYNSMKGLEMKLVNFHKLLKEKMKLLKMDESFRKRFVNEGFSGGEKKRSELLQMLLFEPKLALLDEIDSGLDTDALKLFSTQIAELQKKNKMGLFLITHNTKILKFLDVNKVIILKNGKITHNGAWNLIEEVEKKGFN